MGHDGVLERAAEFLWTHARLLDRRLFECRFANGRPADVVAALNAYQNADGGFGHGLEADLRAPTSTPICVEIALQVLCEAGARDEKLIACALAFLESVADEEGAVPTASREALRYPRAAHWNGDFALVPALNPTASIAGRLHALGVRHAWLDRATEWCFRRLAAGDTGSAHTIRCCLTFLEHVPDRERADGLFEPVMAKLWESDFFTAEVPIERYTLTPLHFATAPHARARSLFADEVIDAHLDDLLSTQQEDGGWPIHWEAPGPAAVSEWRGRWTLEALFVLRAFRRI